MAPERPLIPTSAPRPGGSEGTPFDADAGRFLYVTGKKGTGKSVLARRYWDGYPYDKIVIDPTRDVRKALRDEGVQFIELTDPLPVRLPQPMREGEPGVYVYCPDMGSPTAIDDMDRVMGLALQKGRTAVWVDEIGAYSKVGQTPPNLARALNYGRHDALTLIMAGPRSKNVDPLCIAQADYLAIFYSPSVLDRERLASNIGIPLTELDAAHEQLGKHEYIWFDAAAADGHGMLLIMPALPPRRTVPPQYVPLEQR
jgi:hypothetical protein